MNGIVYLTWNCYCYWRIAMNNDIPISLICHIWEVGIGYLFGNCYCYWENCYADLASLGFCVYFTPPS